MPDQSPPAQCGRTFVHVPHDTTEGRCPGLQGPTETLFPYDLAPLIIRLPESGEAPELLNPEVLGGRGYITLPHEVQFTTFPFPDSDETPMTETLADREADPIRAWMLSGWGDDSDAGRCCPWCRGSLTEHNVAVWQAGYSVAMRHFTEDAQADDTPEGPTYEAGDTLYVVDQQGATYVFPDAAAQFVFAADEATRGAINLETWTCKAPHRMTGDAAASYACSHGPDREDA